MKTFFMYINQLFVLLLTLFLHYSNLQKELRQLSQKQEFVQLLDHCKATCNGVGLSQLLQLPAERVSR